MKKQITGFIVAIFALILLLNGCNKNSVNIYKLSADEQFKYAMKYFKKGDYYKAKTSLSVIVLNNPGNIIVEKAQFYLAESYFYSKEYVLAIQEYSKLIRSLPQSEYVDDSEFKIAMCYYKLSPHYALDQEYTKKAISKFTQFIEEYPNSDLIPKAKSILNECWEKLAKKEFKTGELYRKMGYYDSAVISFDNLLQKYPDSKFVPDALYWKGVCSFKMKKYDQAAESFNKVISGFPETVAAEKSKKKLEEIKKVSKNKE